MLYMQALGKEVPVEGEGEDFAESDYRPFITAAKKARIWAERFMKEGDASLFETVEHISTDLNPLKLGHGIGQRQDGHAAGQFCFWRVTQEFC